MNNYHDKSYGIKCGSIAETQKGPYLQQTQQLDSSEQRVFKHQFNNFKIIQLLEQSKLGRWTNEEHQRFVEALSLHGKNWKKVEDHIGTRSGAQIRSHAQKFFNRLEKEHRKQFNGLNSKEIKTMFEDCSQVNISLKRQKREAKTTTSNQEQSLLQLFDQHTLEDSQEQAQQVDSFNKIEENQQFVQPNTDQSILQAGTFLNMNDFQNFNNTLYYR